MSVATHDNLLQYCKETAARVSQAARGLANANADAKNAWLLDCADALVEAQDKILAANEKDIEAAPSFGLTEAQIDRLRLSPQRIGSIAAGLREIAALPDPIGQTLSGFRRPNGLEIRKIRVPLGTVFFIYESRPNVTADAAAICLKSGNAVILRGGKEAFHSSMALVEIMRSRLSQYKLPTDAIHLVETAERDAVGHFLGLNEFIDVAIPRGGRGLIERVSNEATMPVIKHFDGNCHVYVDKDADPTMAVDIVVNSKCQRMGVCNACESLLIHTDVASELLPQIAQALTDNSVELRGDAQTCDLIPNAVPAQDSDWGEEFLGPTISVKIVPDIQSAIEHINRFGSHHTDAIVTSSLNAANQFCNEVDSSAVIVNASTRFNDGGEFGLGAEIGISTDKFHARGPCGLNELTTYKYVVMGSGQIR